MGLPCEIGDYTDFYTSIHHATTVGKQFRPDNPLLPNYKWVPIGYHGRVSSIGVGHTGTGHTFRRPHGQLKAVDAEVPVLAPSRRMDYELELGAFVGRRNALGEPVPIGEAEDHVFGLALFNDWSARDIQPWEYQPLGPFLSKNFASTLSPWIVTLDALAPFRDRLSARRRATRRRCPTSTRRTTASTARSTSSSRSGCRPRRCAPRAMSATGSRRSNYREAYWTIAQLVAHHTVNGCNLREGDLFGSGTLSGPNPEEGGSLLELSQGGKRPISLSNGETRTFLEDGDTVILRGYCERDGARRIGFGECRGTVLPART